MANRFGEIAEELQHISQRTYNEVVNVKEWDDARKIEFTNHVQRNIYSVMDAALNILTEADSILFEQERETKSVQEQIRNDMTE